MKKLGIVSIILMDLFLCACATTWQKEVRKNLRIEHVYDRPSTAYGPATVVLYTKNSGHTRACWAWQLLKLDFGNIKENDYKSKAEVCRKNLVSFPITDVKIKKTGHIKIGIKLSAQDKAKLSAEYHKISEVSIDLTNGCQYEAPATIKELEEMISKFSCDDSILLRLSRNPKAKVFLVLTTYGYDIDISVKVGKEWKFESELPPEVLDVISAKLNINAKKDKELRVYGNQLYIGFNGDPLFFLEKKTESQMKKRIALYDYVREKQSLTKQIIRFLDITKLFKKKLLINKKK